MKPTSKKAVFALAAMLMSGASFGGESKPELTGPYLGQTPPGTTPEVFAPGIVSTKKWEYGAVFAPGMKELYWVREVAVDGELVQQFVMYEQKDGTWHERVLGDRYGTPTLSRDGNTMFFGRAYKSRTADGWSEPKRLGPDFEDIRIMRVSASDKGTIFFDEANDDSKLRYARFVDGTWEAPKPLPEEINTGWFNAHPFIAPDESYIIWDGQRVAEPRNADLFVSFKQADGSWGEAIKFDERVNTPSADFAAHVSPDGKYLFFNRGRGHFEWTHKSGEVERISNTDTMWVDAKIIEEHRPKN